MKKILLLFVIYISAVSCLPSSMIEDEPTAVPQDLLISMKKLGCYGACPVYELTISGNGDVSYKGEQYVAVEGIRNSKINSSQIQELLTTIENSKFFLLENEYLASSLHLSTVQLSISIEGRSKSIWHYGSLGCSGEYDVAPQELCELENKIDEIVNSEQWVKQE